MTLAVGEVFINHIQSPKLLKAVARVSYQPYVFESVSNGMNLSASRGFLKVALYVVSSLDLSYEILNPVKILIYRFRAHHIIDQIGRHIFAL